MKTFNFTQRKPTPQQIEEAGVVALKDSDFLRVKELLTFDTLPTLEEIEARASAIVQLARDSYTNGKNNRIMIGGAPFLMPDLTIQAMEAGLVPCFPFLKWKSE